jgi:hypothetical protein
LLSAAFTTDPKVTADIEAGRRLTDDAARSLEGTIALHPDDLSARAKLLGYFYDRAAAAPERRLGHVLWFIQNRPADPMTPAYGTIGPSVDPTGYAAATAAWDKQLDAHPTDPSILADAAVFFDNGTDTANAQGFLKRAMDAEPRSATWPVRLAGSLERQATRQPDQAADLCRQALGLRETAYTLAQDRIDRFHVLIGMPMDAYRGGDLIDAKQKAANLLELAADLPDDPSHADAVHRGNIVLGEVALHSGNVGRAEEYLAAAAMVKPSPTLSTTGPDLALAKELLARGERTPVKNYLVACESLWTGGGERLKRWVATLDGGGSPDW